MSSRVAIACQARIVSETAQTVTARQAIAASTRSGLVSVRAGGTGRSEDIRDEAIGTLPDRWRRGGVATQRPAKPCTPVRFRSSPLGGHGDCGLKWAP